MVINSNPNGPQQRRGLNEGRDTHGSRWTQFEKYAQVKLDRQFP